MDQIAGNELALRDEVRNEIAGGIDPVRMAAVFLPRMERALEVAQTAQETNEIRSQIETVMTYIRRSLPKLNRNRVEQFKYTHESDMLYLKASAKAGAMWKACEEKATQGSGMAKRSENFRNVISWLDAGFKNDRDVTDCQRLSELHEEDWRTYEEETLTNLRQPTINGAMNVWRMLYGERPEPKEIEVDLSPEGKELYRVIKELRTATIQYFKFLVTNKVEARELFFLSSVLGEAAANFEVAANQLGEINGQRK